jgi:hypothetical protein
LAKRTERFDLSILAALSIIAVVLWSVTAFFLFGCAKPYTSLDNGRTLVFDPLALVWATSIMTGIAILSWIPVLIFAQRGPRLLSAGLATASTWICLGVPFWLIDRSGLGDLAAFRASEVMGNGQDMVFLPLVIPLVSFCSGAAYSMAMWLTIRLKQNIQSRGQRAS